MDIPVKVSSKMDQAEAPALESRTIRIPAEFRKTLDYVIGDSVTVRAKDGRILSLMVDKAYEEDAKSDPMNTYVTSAVFNLIANAGTTSCDVNLVDGITLGCDPELMVIDRNTGDLVSAQYFFGLTKWNAVGYDGLLLEFRPLPSTSEDVVIDNIYNLLGVARQALNRSKMYPSTMMAGISSYHGRAAVARNAHQNTAVITPNTRLTAGFHLHYGLPREILGWNKSFVARQMVKALDYYVGIPSMIPEGYNDSYRRTVQGIAYGKPGEFRLDHRTLEYRTPGGALMKHPILAKGLIGLGAVVVEDIVSRVRVKTHNFTKLDEISKDSDIKFLYPNIPPVMSIFQAICSPTIDAAKGHLDMIRKDVEKMVGYARRASSIDNFFNNIETAFSIDTEENWWRYKRHGERQSG